MVSVLLRRNLTLSVKLLLILAEHHALLRHSSSELATPPAVKATAWQDTRVEAMKSSGEQSPGNLEEVVKALERLKKGMSAGFELVDGRLDAVEEEMSAGFKLVSGRLDAVEQQLGLHTKQVHALSILIGTTNEAAIRAAVEREFGSEYCLPFKAQSVADLTLPLPTGLIEGDSDAVEACYLKAQRTGAALLDRNVLQRLLTHLQVRLWLSKRSPVFSLYMMNSNNVVCTACTALTTLCLLVGAARCPIFARRWYSRPVRHRQSCGRPAGQGQHVAAPAEACDCCVTGCGCSCWVTGCPAKGECLTFFQMLVCTVECSCDTDAMPSTQELQCKDSAGLILQESETMMALMQELEAKVNDFMNSVWPKSSVIQQVHWGV